MSIFRKMLTQKHIRTIVCFIRQYSQSVKLNETEVSVTKSHKSEILSNNETKSLKIALLGLPNAGKSTLVNQLLNRSVCPASAKVHTTRVKCDAVYSENNTQLIFIDTPGIVKPQDLKKYKLDNNFQHHPKQSLIEADVIGVVHNVHHRYERHRIDKEITDTLSILKEEKPIILIMNKVDRIKDKTLLLQLAKKFANDSNGPKFSDVFMVSALTGNGLEDLKTYFLDSAIPRDWNYKWNTYTDQSPEKIIEQTVRARLLDCLPNEMPYALQVQVEYFNISPEGNVCSAVTIVCPRIRISKFVVGSHGSKIKNIALQAEEELRHAFRTQVNLKVNVYCPEKE